MGASYGGLVGHVADASRFLRMHLRDGELDGQRVLAAQTSRRMRVIDQPGKPFDHGIGWFRRPTSNREHWVEHFGAGAGFWNVMRLYPDAGPRHRRHEQQHHRVRLRAPLRAAGRCVMVVIAIIAMIRGIQAILRNRAAQKAQS